MKRRTIGIATGAALAVVGVVVVHGARAQSVPTYCCSSADGQCVASSGACTSPAGQNVELTFSPSAGGVTMRVVNTEPPGGFTGACLLPFVTYAPMLPTVCYSPAGNIQYGIGTTRVTAPNASVARTYGTTAAYDSFQAVTTCYPHNADGTCPTAALAVSHSCCELGTNMVSADGQYATGLANFSTF
jgi:hypothetical protein